MASITESMTISCSSRFGISVSPPFLGTLPPAVTLPGRKGFAEFKGLKIKKPSPFASLNSSNPKVCRLRGGINVCQAPGTALDIPSVTETTWESLVLKADGPVLVEFWAPWCGPCRVIHPVIGELAQEYAEKLKCFRVNTDDSPSIASRYGIRSVPTIIIFREGEKKDAVMGAVPKSTLTASIEKLL